MGKIRRAKRNANKARSAADRGQNVLLRNVDKRLKSLESVVEQKYAYEQQELLGIRGWDPTSQATRQSQLVNVQVGTSQDVTDNNGRIGDKITVKNIDFRYSLGIEGSASGNPGQPVTKIRVMLFWDNEPVYTNTAGAYLTNVPEWQQLLQGLQLTTPAQTSLFAMSPLDHDKKRRFTIIHDEVHTLCPLEGTNGGARSATNQTRKYKAYKVGKKIRYSGGGIVPINRALYVAYISDNTQGPYPYISYALKTQYEDA
ncbi:MAG: putative capsid protein [Cressdnaviricota sp.]|nr:MAG: putative capsid protein [Cressdnaviricota sp.]